MAGRKIHSAEKVWIPWKEKVMLNISKIKYEIGQDISVVVAAPYKNPSLYEKRGEQNECAEQVGA